MHDPNCVFCKIIRQEIPSFKVYEDEEFLAILDINPNTEGATVLISKAHYPSDIVTIDENVYKKFFMTARRVSRILNERLHTKRCSIVLEGMGVNHAHLKVYPMHGLGQHWKATESDKRVFYEQYPGFITTKLGPAAKHAELERVAKKIWE